MSAFWIINILIFFLCSLIYKNRDEIEVLCIDNTNSLRGIFMLLMISHHVSICLGNDKDILVRILATLGGMLTGVYFFLSGYGNYMSYKRNCLKGMSWFGKRVFYIIVPFEICYPIISMLSKSSRGGYMEHLLLQYQEQQIGL